MDESPKPLLRTSEARLTSMSLPVMLSNRLDRLVARVGREGVTTSRKDLIAALILAAPEDPTELLEMSLRYGRATLSDAALKDEPQASVLDFSRRKPGRRPHPE